MHSLVGTGRTAVMKIDDIVDKLRSGDENTLARAITLVEQRALERIPLLKALFPFTGRAQIIGLTGAPGSGKSTLAGQMIRAYRRRNKTVGVLAIDPTSPYSGGATLGDRIRMQNEVCDSGVFIRSMASRGQLGGLAPATADAAAVLDASGRDRILIETVGVGQDQLDIVSVADVLVVLTVPGMGDEVQVAKAGIMEAADVFVVNKSDREGADQAERILRDGVALTHRHLGWTPPIIRTIATTGNGVSDLVVAIDDYFHNLQQGDLAHHKATEKWRLRLLQMVREHLMEHLLNPDYRPLFQAYATAVAERRVDPYTIVERLLGRAMEGSDELKTCHVPAARDDAGPIAPSGRLSARETSSPPPSGTWEVKRI
jgi:LAO/AO transport system kinase